MPPYINPDDIRDPKRLNTEWKYHQIEWVADKIHSRAWLNIGEIPPYEIKAIIELCGFQVVEEPSLGMLLAEGRLEEAAGIADGENGIVRLSLFFPKEVQRFTAGHELGHFFLHRELGLHRDLPVDGKGRRRRTQHEREADYFSGCILMPRRRMREEFQMRFLTDQFVPHHTLLVALYGGRESPRSRWDTPMNAARELTRATFFNWRHIEPLHSRFGVSVEAMAVRIVQLGLVKL